MLFIVDSNTRRIHPKLPCSIRNIANRAVAEYSARGLHVLRLIVTMRRGSASGLAAAWTRYPTIEAARSGAEPLMRDDRVVRVMIVRDDMPPAFVEWVER